MVKYGSIAGRGMDRHSMTAATPALLARIQFELVVNDPAGRIVAT